MSDIKIEMVNCKTSHFYNVIFEDAPDVEERVIAYLTARRSTHSYVETEESPIDPQYEKLLDFLYPSCVHGLSAWLCEGPNHYPMDM